jgi:hypothetical protein
LHANPRLNEFGPIRLVDGAKNEHRNEAAVPWELLLQRLEREHEADQKDPVDEASNDSFPASDAPAWATGQARES